MTWNPTRYRPGHSSLGQRDTDISTWSIREKVLFLNAYGWISAASAKDIPVGDGFFTGVLHMASDLTKNYIRAAAPALNLLPEDVQGSITKMEENLGPVVSTAEKSRSEARKYLDLRDAVVKDLAEKGLIIEYERWGDDPRFPGELVKATLVPLVREGAKPDFSFVFSTMSPREFVQAGRKIQEIAEEIGHKPDRPFSLAGAQLGIGIGVIVAIIAIVVAGLWALWGIAAEVGGAARRKTKEDHLRAAVENGELSEAEALSILTAEDNQDDYFDKMFDPITKGFTILLAVAVAAIGIPLVLSLTSTSK